MSDESILPFANGIANLASVNEAVQAFLASDRKLEVFPDSEVQEGEEVVGVLTEEAACLFLLANDLRAELNRIVKTEHEKYLAGDIPWLSGESDHTEMTSICSQLDLLTSTAQGLSDLAFAMARTAIPLDKRHTHEGIGIRSQNRIVRLAETKLRGKVISVSKNGIEMFDL